MKSLLLILVLGFCGVVSAGSPPGHWSFPGDIQSHLRNGHGISTAGMSYEEMLNTHDSIHRAEKYGSASSRVSATSKASTVSKDTTKKKPLKNCIRRMRRR